MNINMVSDEVSAYLNEKHLRVYRNRAIKSPEFIYIVYKVESVINTYPSEDLYLNIDIYEDISKSVREMEDLADLIDNDLNHKVIDTEKLNLHFEREQRQYISPEDLVSTHLINLRYVVRAYFK